MNKFHQIVGSTCYFFSFFCEWKNRILRNEPRLCTRVYTNIIFKIKRAIGDEEREGREVEEYEKNAPTCDAFEITRTHLWPQRS